MDYNTKRLTLYHHDLYYSCALYTPKDETKKKTTIIICHGNYPEGKDAQLIQKIIKELVKKNYIVFAFDNLLYNKSWSPLDLECFQFNEIDFRLGVYVSLEYLFSIDNVDKSRVFVLGHSLGGSVSIASGALDDRIRGIISISPTHVERFIYDDNNLENYLQENFVNRLGCNISKDKLKKIRFDTNEENYINFLRKKPLLLVYGSSERFWGYGSWINSYWNRIGKTADIVKIKNAGHYFGCVPDKENSSVFSKLIEQIYYWIERTD